MEIRKMMQSYHLFQQHDSGISMIDRSRYSQYLLRADVEGGHRFDFRAADLGARGGYMHRTWDPLGFPAYHISLDRPFQPTQSNYNCTRVTTASLNDSFQFMSYLIHRWV